MSTNRKWLLFVYKQHCLTKSLNFSLSKCTIRLVLSNQYFRVFFLFVFRSIVLERVEEEEGCPEMCYKLLVILILSLILLQYLYSTFPSPQPIIPEQPYNATYHAPLFSSATSDSNQNDIRNLSAWIYLQVLWKFIFNITRVIHSFINKIPEAIDFKGSHFIKSTLSVFWPEFYLLSQQVLGQYSLLNILVGTI